MCNLSVFAHKPPARGSENNNSTGICESNSRCFREVFGNEIPRGTDGKHKDKKQTAGKTLSFFLVLHAQFDGFEHGRRGFRVFRKTRS